jgi:diaminopimelate epimerase
MQGCGNDYIFIDATKNDFKFIDFENRNIIAKKISDRHFGIGADGAVFIEKSNIKDADFKMDFYNSDGSFAKMCGTAVRCLARYTFEKGLTDKLFQKIETGAGIREVSLEYKFGNFLGATVLMGKPIFNSKSIPSLIESDRLFNYPILIGGKIYLISAVSVGNPHAVIFCNDVDDEDLDVLGEVIGKNPIFPEGVNVEIASVYDDKIKMRVFERGSGETLSCGTGASAVAVIANEQGRCGERVEIHTKGGRLKIFYDKKSKNIYLRGEAKFVFDGEISADIALNTL